MLKKISEFKFVKANRNC